MEKVLDKLTKGNKPQATTEFNQLRDKFYAKTDEGNRKENHGLDRVGDEVILKL